MVARPPISRYLLAVLDCARFQDRTSSRIRLPVRSSLLIFSLRNAVSFMVKVGSLFKEISAALVSKKTPHSVSPV